MAPSILLVSRERWVQELDKLLLSESPRVGLEVLARTRLLNFMVPELALQVGYCQDSPYHRLDLWDHTIRVVDLSDPVVEIRWAALLHDIAKPFVRTQAKAGHSNYLDHAELGSEMVERLGLYLRWSTARLTWVKGLVRGHLAEDSPLKQADDGAK